MSFADVGAPASRPGVDAGWQRGDRSDGMCLVHSRPYLVRRSVQLLVGLAAFGVAVALMVRAHIGLAPWDVLGQGLALRTGISFGLVLNLVGLVVLLAWIPLRQRPGVGTVLNVLLIGPAADLTLWLVPEPEALPARIALFAAGLTLLAVATGLYLGARLGPGPRDGLMTGLHARTGWPVWTVRTGIEVSALGLGWLLGGDVGLGTLAFALLIGPMVQVAMPRLAIPEPLPVSAPGEPSDPEPCPAL